MNNRHKKALKALEVKVISTSVITDRALNLMANKANLRIEGPFNYRTKWVHDVFCNTIWELIKAGISQEEIDKKEGIFEHPPKTLDDVADMINKLQNYLPKIIFTDKEFRETTGLKHLSGEAIRELVRDYNKLSLNGYIQLFHDSETGKYSELLFEHYTLGGIVIKESGNYSRRNQKPEHRYLATLNFYGLIVLHNLLTKSYTKFPQRFYKLKRAGQEIYRKIAQHPGSRFNIITLARYIGYSENIINKSHIEQIAKWIEVALDELVKEKFIKGWKLNPEKNTGAEREYLIQRKERLPWKPKRLLENGKI